jgi:hypothetical protein
MVVGDRAVSRLRIAAEDVRGQPGLSRSALAAVLAAQPSTVTEALRIRGVGRKTTRLLLDLGLVADPERVQARRGRHR